MAPSDNCSHQPKTWKVVGGPYKSQSLSEYNGHLIHFSIG
jgi:hypothetical protein